MKQVAQNYRSGELTVLDTPPPALRPGGVLVRSLYSLISTGTEVMKVKEARLSLAGKARARPEQVRQVVDTVTQQGPVAAYKKVMNKLDSYTPLGYSLCGVVEQVGAGAEEFSVGQLVACAGNEHALHAEVNWVPVNLCVPVPEHVKPEFAAFATVGAIAMQGVRRCEAQLGDTACVIGLGLVGQLAVQLLVAAGVRVVGLDPVAERCKMAEAAGAMSCTSPDAEGIDRIGRVLADATGGLGADHILIVAGGTSNGPVEAAATLARDRATVVDIGKTRLDLPWNAYYDKELDVRFSRSYGPGRYDDRYELEGIDYPAGYVRWTERRNLACFIDLIAREELDVLPLVNGTFPVDKAVEVYDQLASGELKGVGFLFEYPRPEEDPDHPAATHPPKLTIAKPAGTTRVNRAPRSTVSVGFIGAGNYASSMLLPHLTGKPDVELRRVATNRSLSALDAKRRFGFADASTNSDDILSDDSIDCVFVVTRHHSHADITCRALEAGKAVFVEKPLALTEDQLTAVLDTVERTGNDRLMVGFNRRFAPMFTEMRTRFGSRTTGSVARYAVNAGTLGSRSWYNDEKLEGSRFAGEGGHFIDTLSWWFDALPTEVFTMTTKDPHDLLINLRFSDGSIATLTYVTNGNSKFPKEVFDVSASGSTARLDNFRSASVWSGRRKRVARTFGSLDKGQAGQLEAFLTSLKTGSKMPISLDSLAATTRATFAVAASQASGRPETV
ncbi:MAG: bi-domain-containing oxidoreductase [Acidimicrobiales bacterium]|jgi:predicted dehydrogenase/threonine dehydrogenase-like Zn-dependent dehydrogenase